MQKLKKGLMYTFGGGTLVAVGYSLAHLAVGQGDVTSQAAGIAFGIGCVAGFFYGLWRKFA